MKQSNHCIKVLMPLWQGGNNPAYSLGAKLLDWLSPQSNLPSFEIPISEYQHPLTIENGITGRRIVKEQLQKAHDIIVQQNPERIITLGGDCLVSLVPFAQLIERYGDDLGILWIDSHPDIQTAEHHSNSHSHVLGALLGHGDPDLMQFVKKTVSSKNVMIAGVHTLLDHENQFLINNNIATVSPEEIKAQKGSVKEWIETQGIKYLAIHIDLDVLDPHYFRSVLFARPGREPDEFGGVAEGKLVMSDVISLVNEATTLAEPVGLTLAEHLPWDAINLKAMLAKLPLLKNDIKSN